MQDTLNPATTISFTVARQGPVRLQVFDRSTMATTQLPKDFKEFLSLLILDDVEVNLISLHHLKVNKKARGRLKDLADLENLPD